MTLDIICWTIAWMVSVVMLITSWFVPEINSDTAMIVMLLSLTLMRQSILIDKIL